MRRNVVWRTMHNANFARISRGTHLTSLHIPPPCASQASQKSRAFRCSGVFLASRKFVWRFSCAFPLPRPFSSRCSVRFGFGVFVYGNNNMLCAVGVRQRTARALANFFAYAGTAESHRKLFRCKSCAMRVFLATLAIRSRPSRRTDWGALYMGMVLILQISYKLVFV